MTKLLIISAVLLTLCIQIFSQQWVQVGNGLNGTVRTITPSNAGYIYAGGDFTNSGNLFIGKVGMWTGSSWLGTDTMNTFNNSVFVLHKTPNLLYAGGSFNQKIMKYSAATLWTPMGTIINDFVYAITSVGSNIYAGGSFAYPGSNTTRLNYVGMWNGSGWSPLDTGLNATVSALAVMGGNLYVGGSFYKTYAGMDLKRIGMWNGHWNQLGTGIPNGWVNALAVSGNDLYVAGSFSLSTPNGVAHNIAKWNGSSWSVVGTPQTPGLNDEVLCIAVVDGTVYAGGFFTATHGGNTTANRIAKWDGTSWQAIGAGFNAPVRSICIAGSYLYSGGDFITSGSTSILHIAKWSVPIGIHKINNEIPVKHSLLQNYPNPFNPSTKIVFDIPTASNVKIEVFDITGKRIEELVNENVKAGSYEVEWSASKLSSGTYFYRMQAGSYAETKKMILIK
jgi:trimeric autotransporter adhesin